MSEAAIWFLGITLLGSGIVIGLALRRRDGSHRIRELELEQQLAHERESFASYREQVNRHVDQTAHLFRDLTNQHAALYDHLRQGARELAPKPDRLGGQEFGSALVEFAAVASAARESVRDSGEPLQGEIPGTAAGGASRDSGRASEQRRPHETPPSRESFRSPTHASA